MNPILEHWNTKVGQNKKGHKMFFESFFSAVSCKKEFKKNGGVARTFFDPSYFDLALSEISSAYIKNKIHFLTFPVGFWIPITVLIIQCLNKLF